MKRKTMYLTVIIALMSVGLTFGQTKSEKFKVFGNCGMCEKTIEKAANGVEGVSTADWNKESKMIEVSLDTTKTNVHKVHMAIADAGYDTKMHKATDEAYNKLPSCCQYDREKAEKKEVHHHKH